MYLNFCLNKQNTYIGILTIYIRNDYLVAIVLLLNNSYQT